MSDPLQPTLTDWEHCRMCAQHKSCGDLLDLTADGKTYVEYLELFGFLKIDFVDLSESNPLPKTTCMTCNDSIQDANTFFHNVNKAQFTLKKIVSSCFKPDPIGSPIIQITARTEETSDYKTVKLESLSNDDEFCQKKLIYCRFCAEQKYSTELTDLSEYNTLQKYERYLDHFKIDYVDLYLPRLPKTCCASCDRSFERAYQFFETVKANQIILNKLYGLKSEVMIKLEAFDNSELESTALSKACIMVDTNNVVDTKTPELRDGTPTVVEGTPLAYCAVTIDDVKVDNSWNSYPWSCGACETRVPSLALLRSHAKARHGACAATVCADCQQPYGCYAEFVDHVRTHREQLRMFCEYCNERFDSSEACGDHVTRHLEGTQNICELCGEVLPYANTLSWHRRLYGRKGLGALGTTGYRAGTSSGTALGDQGWDHYPWACRECGSVFSSLSVLSNHSASEHDTCFSAACADCTNITSSKGCKDYRQFVEHVHAHRPHLRFFCQYCNTNFVSLDDVNQHILQHITSQQRPCLHCGQIFDNNTLLAQHKRQFGPNRSKSDSKSKIDSKKVTKTPRRRKPVQQEGLTTSDLTCTICTKQFKSLPALKRHEKTHDFSRPRDFICPTCGRAFLTRNTMKDHIKTHSSVKTEICQVCNKEFHTRPKLKAHIITHSEERPFVCDTCGASFKTRKRLKSHLKCHSAEKPFKCSYCYKDFKFKENLKTHEYQHTGQRPYCCEFCARTFTNWTNCNKHMVRKHGVTLARTKITSQGRVPIDRTTGEAPRLPCDQTATAWIDAMLRPVKRGKRNTS